MPYAWEKQAFFCPPNSTVQTVYTSENLDIIKVAPDVYVHISYLATKEYGKVACNGMFVQNENKAVVFDTPATPEASKELITFITQNLNTEITALIPTHFHIDCVGGLDLFRELQIPSYATSKTIDLLDKSGQKSTNDLIPFEDTLELEIGNKKVYASYFGEGHTADNIIGYYPEDKVIFGGCLIKELNGPKGNLEDATTSEWSETVRKVKQSYPSAQLVIPGHGEWGGKELLDYTIALFRME